MDILIKGIEMPKRCTGCFNSKCLLFFEHIDPNNSRHPNCPLVALPEHHGRLGDLDALKNSVADMRMEKPLRNGAKQVIEIGELFGRIIDDAPAILEETK